MVQTFPCPKCGSQNFIGQRFCGACGERFEYRCVCCGGSIDPGLRFCSNCGTAISGGALQPGKIPNQPMWRPSATGKPLFLSMPFLMMMLAILLLCIGGFAFWQLTPKPPTDTTAPIISSVSVLSKTRSGATITWKTDAPASSQVEYGRTPSYGSVAPPQPRDNPASGTSAGVTTHSITLSGLQSGTIYHFRVKSNDAAGNEATSVGDRTFKTREPSLY